MAYASTPADWRDLARRVQNENDPYKMVELAQQLVARLDEEISKAAPAPIAISTEKQPDSFSAVRREPS